MFSICADGAVHVSILKAFPCDRELILAHSPPNQPRNPLARVILLRCRQSIPSTSMFRIDRLSSILLLNHLWSPLDLAVHLQSVPFLLSTVETVSSSCLLARHSPLVYHLRSLPDPPILLWLATSSGCICTDDTSPYARMRTLFSLRVTFRTCHPMHMHWLKMFERFCVSL